MCLPAGKAQAATVRGAAAPAEPGSSSQNTGRTVRLGCIQKCKTALQRSWRCRHSHSPTAEAGACGVGHIGSAEVVYKLALVNSARGKVHT